MIRPRTAKATKIVWIVVGAFTAALVAYCGWLVLTDAPAYQFLVRLYMDKRFLKHMLREWGVLAPVVFIGLQALQVVIAPIPGDLTGILGGYLFGQWVALLAAPKSALVVGAGFVLFRAFDIGKPWPVSWADRELKGGLGVMADDLLAGVLAAVVLQLSVRLIHLQS